MALKTVAFILLIATSIGRPIDEDREAKIRHFQSSSSSSSSSSSMSVSGKPGQLTHSHQSASVMVSTNNDGKVTQSEFHSSSVGSHNNQSSFIITSSAINGERPHTVVITRDPVTGTIVKNEYNGTINRPKTIISSDTDVVQSDFAASNLSDFPDEGESDFTISQIGDLPVTGDLPFDDQKNPEMIQESTTVGDNIIFTFEAPSTSSTTSATEQLITSVSSEGEKLDAILSSQKPLTGSAEVFTIQQKPYTNEMTNKSVALNNLMKPVSSVIATKPVEDIMLDGSVNKGTSTTYSVNNISPTVTQKPENNAILGGIVTSVDKQTVPKTTTPRTVMQELYSLPSNSIKNASQGNFQSSSVLLNKGTMQVEEIFNKNIEAITSSSAVTPNYSIVQNIQQAVGLSNGPFNRQPIRNSQSHFETSSFTVNQSPSGEAVVVSTSSVNGAKPTSTITVSNPLTGEIKQNRIEGSLPSFNNRVTGNQQFQEVSVSGNVFNRQPVSTNAMLGQVSQSSFQSSSVSQNSAGEAVIVSTSSVNGEKPMTTITVTNPFTGEIKPSELQGNSAMVVTGNQVFQGASTFNTAVNRQPILTGTMAVQPLLGQISQSSFQSSSVSVNKNSAGENIVSTSSFNGGNPTTSIAVTNPLTSEIKHSEDQKSSITANNRVTGNQAFQGALTSNTVVNRQPILTSAMSPKPFSSESSQGSFQSSSVSVNKNAVGENVIVSTSSMNGEKPMSTITVTNPLTSEIKQSELQGSSATVNNRISQASSASSIAVNRQPITAGTLSTLPLLGQISHSSFQSSSASVNKNSAGEAVIISTSSANGEKPMTTTRVTNPLISGVKQSEFQGSSTIASNRVTGNQLQETGISGISLNQQPPARPLVAQSSGSNVQSPSATVNKNLQEVVASSSSTNRMPTITKVPQQSLGLPSTSVKPFLEKNTQTNFQSSSATVNTSKHTAGERVILSTNSANLRKPITTVTTSNHTTGKITQSIAPSLEQIGQSKIKVSDTMPQAENVALNGKDKLTNNQKKQPHLTSIHNRVAEKLNGEKVSGSSSTTANAQALGTTERTTSMSCAPLETTVVKTPTSEFPATDQVFQESVTHGSYPSTVSSNSYTGHFHEAFPISYSTYSSVQYSPTHVTKIPSGFVQTTYISPSAQQVLIVDSLLGHHIQSPYEDFDSFHGDLSSLKDRDYSDFEEEYPQPYISKGPSISSSSQIQDRFSSGSVTDERDNYGFGYFDTQQEAVSNDFEKYGYSPYFHSRRNFSIW